MPSAPPDDTPSVQIANQIINIANTRMQDGLDVNVVAIGLRHAAANFSAFAENHQGSDDPAPIVEEFVRLLEYYLSRHATPEQPAPAAGLNQLIKQVKDEF
ncbi:MAG: DUF3144 domain-containing protein [Alphaproteobacteria bacterium]|nr:DUF3144 domain-containing protein [Alphaproteobacteria bacterium]MBT7941965.1 DUF3144 domain-containing protein [Alphaproteobacteria bacterium]